MITFTITIIITIIMIIITITTISWFTIIVYFDCYYYHDFRWQEYPDLGFKICCYAVISLIVIACLLL